MYQVILGDLNSAYKTLYYPGDEQCVIYDTKLNLEVGSAGVFEFNLPPENPLYSEVINGSIISILRDDKEFWRGYVTEINTDFNKIASIYCVEDIMWLDSEYTFVPFKGNWSYSYELGLYISKFNENRPEDRHFIAGIITNVNPSDVSEWISTYDESALAIIRKCLCQDSGYLKVRRVTENGHVDRYIDCLRLMDYGVISTQIIEFSDNLLDYAEEMDGSNIVNVLYPYGAELEEEYYEGLKKRIQGTTVTSNSSMATYGRRERSVVFDEANTAQLLSDLALAYVRKYSQPQLKLKLTAIDLADLGQGDSHFNIGDQVHVIAEPFGIDQWIYVTEQDIDIQNPAGNKITLSDDIKIGSQSLTKQTIDTAELLKNVPTESSVIDSARQTALKLLQGANGGHVSFGTDEDGNIDELRIANAEDIEQATKKWIWNVNGLGYMERQSSNDDWSSPEIAMTMDGSIVADSITSGSLTLGNGGTDAPLLQAYSGNNLVTRINRNGLYATAGEVAGYTIDATTGFRRSTGNQYCEYSHHKMHIGGLWNNSYWTFVGISNMGEFIHLDYGASNAGGLWITKNGANDMYNFSGDTTVVKVNSVSCSAYGQVEWSGSDRKLKDNIEDLSLEESKAIIENARPRKFDMKADEDGKRYGFIAQELREVLPEDSGIEFGDEIRNIHYKDFIAPLVNCVNDLYSQIDELRSELKKYKEEK